jgi:hypothetical protein
MTMRDGMPGPGWWIASDGRWYPPELHPDVRARAAVVVDEPVAPASFATQSLPASFEISPVVSRGPANGTVPQNGTVSRNGAPAANGGAPISNGGTFTSNGARSPIGTLSKEKEAFLASLRSSNGAAVPARDRVETTAPAAVITAPPVETTAPVTDTSPRPSRSASQRLAFGIGLAAATLLVIVYFARGHGGRPSFDVSEPTTVATTVQAAPATGAPATGAPATGVTSSSAPGTSPAASSVTTTRAGTAPTTSTVTAAKVTPKVVSVFDLVKGNCVDGAGLSDGLVTTIRVVDCTEVHTHEVYYSGRYPESTFDANRISAYANDTCLSQFASYVGIDYTRSRYQYLHIVPTQESWTRDNDRDVVCVAFDEDATITGTLAGRAQ